MKYIKRSSTIILAALLISPVLALVSPVSASGNPCGTVITSNLTLTANWNCGSTSPAITVGASYITINCQGHSLTTTGEYGIFSNGYYHVTIKNCKLLNAEYGIYFENGGYNKFAGNRLTSNIDDGLALGYEEDDVVTNNIATLCGYGFDTYYTYPLTMTGNLATHNTDAGFTMDQYDGVGPDPYITLTGNGATYNAGPGFILDLFYKSTVSHDTSMNNYVGFVILDASATAFSSNVATSNELSGFLITSGSSANTFTSNTAQGNGHSGFDIRGGSNLNTFTKNTANDNDYLSCNGWAGFSNYDGSYDNTFTSNTANGNCEWGFDSYESGGNTFTSNTANTNLIGFYEGDIHDTFTNNMAASNIATGFSLFEGTLNTFTGNTATHSTGTGTFGQGFFVIGETNSVLTNNVASNNNNEGFFIDHYDGTTGLTLTGNAANSNGYYGFRDTTTGGPSGSPQFGTLDSYNSNTCDGLNNLGFAQSSPAGLC
jgi:parallel beta-helix repeat protein